ncbi:transposase [Ancylobacter oerskovii]|nr:transposase [Ancylobacter oerskovii]
MPEDFGGHRTKPEIALAEIDRARTAGLRFGCVLADAGYGLSAPFRQGLSARGLTWAVGWVRARRSIRSTWPSSFPSRGAAARARTTCPTGSRCRRGRRWRRRPGAR